MFPIERLYLQLCHVVSLCLPCTHAQHLENSPVAGLARLNCYYMKASQPACRASPVGVKRAGLATGLARFRDVYVTWRSGVGRWLKLGGPRSLEICRVVHIADAIRAKGAIIKGGGPGGFSPGKF